jgi:hypothetical protein
MTTFPESVALLVALFRVEDALCARALRGLGAKSAAMRKMVAAVR